MTSIAFAFPTARVSRCDQPDRECLVGLHEPSAEDEVLRPARPDQPGEPLRPARARDDPEAGLRLAELRRLGGDNQVAGHCQLAAAAQAESGHRRDERRPHLADRVPAVDPPRLVHLDRARLRHLADVRPGREGALGAAEHDAANRVVAVQLGERLHERAHDLVVQRVQGLGPVEQDDPDRGLPLDEDDSHSLPSRNLSTAARGSSVAIESASQSRA
jgi:hypothetical protein